MRSRKEQLAWLATLRWPNGAQCPYCSSRNVKERIRELRYRCNSCNTTFSVTVGTAFHQTHLPLVTWFKAVVLIVTSETTISTRKLAEDLSVDKDTAWRISLRIKEAMQFELQRQLMHEISVGYEAMNDEMNGNDGM